MMPIDEKLAQLDETINRASSEITRLNNENERYKNAIGYIISEVIALQNTKVYDEFDDGFQVALRMVMDVVTKGIENYKLEYEE